jgi:hypothetical protein
MGLMGLVLASCGEVPKGEEAEPYVAAASSAESDSSAGSSADEEPLLLEADDSRPEEEPLLLLDDSMDTTEAAVSMADNSRCHVCHVNYQTEDVAVVHARAGMGCAACHGASDEHIADESWASGGNGTAPDTMFTLEQINPFCLDCHSKEEIGERAHEAVLAGTSEKKYCTDCHGDHRLHERRCKWK